MNIKAVALDIDGTITTKNRRVPPESVEAIQKLEEAEIPVILASGNVLPVAYGLGQYLGATGPIVAENGGVVFYRREIEILQDNGTALEAYERIKNMKGVERLFTDRWRISEVGLKKGPDIEGIKERLKSLPVSVVTTGYAIHIMDGRMNKMRGIERGAELLGIKTGEILAIGDSHNDMEMLEGCGMSGVPASASDEVKMVANIVSDREYYEGFLDILERAGLIQAERSKENKGFITQLQ